jgi:hypothetical protein
VGESAWNYMLEILTGVCIASVLLSGSKFMAVIYLHIFMAYADICDIN